MGRQSRALKVLGLAIAAVAICPGFGHAQKGGEKKTPLQIEAEERAKRAKEVDKEYDLTMKRLKAQGPAAASDPWKKVRPSATGGGNN